MLTFQSHIDPFESWLDQLLGGLFGHPKLQEASLAGIPGGKRFRAVLVFAATELAGRSFEEAFPLAGAVEMIHAYSLVHDDLPALDDASLRRGQPTLHKQFGEAMAILAGDALLTEAFTVLADLKAEPRHTVVALKTLAQAAGGRGMIAGQVGDILDLEAVDTVEQVRAIHKLKTGALIEWSVLTPLKIWNPEYVDVLTPYAEELGVLFQVRDDLLDLDPDAAQDKDRSADGAKSTYARLLGSDGARVHAQNHLEACLQRPHLCLNLIAPPLPSLPNGRLGACSKCRKKPAPTLLPKPPGWSSPAAKPRPV